MTRPDSESTAINLLNARVEKHVARHLERGDTVFYARPLLASLAIGLMTGDRYREAFNGNAQAAVDALEAHEAEGEVFAVRQDLGNGLEDSRDKIRVTRRNGEDTGALYGTEHTPGRQAVIRLTTPQA